MTNWTIRFVAVSTVVTVACATTIGADLNVSVTSEGSSEVTVVPCGGSVVYEVRGLLSDQANEGLAGFLLKLEFSGGPLEPADTPTTSPMLSFDRPAGVSGADGFGGKVVDGRLVLVGGAQNTINNTPDIAPFPVGTVIPNVGHTEVVLVTGSLTAPTEPGTYRLRVFSVTATVIAEGEDGTPFWATEPAAAGTITDLVVVVPPSDPVASASNDGPVCGGDDVTLWGGPDGMAAYAWSGPGGFTSSEQNPVVSPAALGTYTLTVSDTGACISTARTTVQLVPLPCEPWTDCNTNGVHDECELFEGTSEDVNANGIPDECEADCNSNGVPDDYDIDSGASEDCSDNGIPDECEPDCNTNGVADSCDISQGTSTDCNGNDIPDECDLLEGPDADCNDNGILDECDIAGGLSEDCTGDGTPDDCEPDCNGNNIADSCDIAAGTSQDCNSDGIPDDCQLDPDCNADGIPDDCQLDPDCNGDGVPDECQLDPDCNGDGIPDDCQLAPDCNSNGIPDECEADCNSNGIPDSCDIAAGTSQDLNGNGVPDECDVPGDLDGDGDVDGDDYLIFVAAIPSCEGDTRYNPAADFDGDGCVTLVDYQIWLMLYADANPPQPAPVPRPKPGKPGDTDRMGAHSGK